MYDQYFSLPNFSYRLEKVTYYDYSSTKQKLAQHIFGDDTKKLAVVIPGFSEHCAYVKKNIHHFLAQGYQVYCFDLPGHGLSSGEHYDIDHFQTYRLMFEAIIKLIPPQKDCLFWCHSTGAIGITSFLLDNPSDSHPFNKIILTAPLVRPYMWPLIKTLLFFLPFHSKIKRLERIVSPEYQQIKNTDPLIGQSIPVHWLKQFQIYWKKMKNLNTLSDEEILVFISTQDKIVDSNCTYKFYRKHFPKATKIQLSGATHHPHLNSPEITQNYFSQIDQYLKGTL